MTTHTIIYAWGDFGPDSVTGQWSANTFYDESAEPYVPLAAIAAAYEDAADTCADETWHHVGDDAYSRGLDRGAAEQASTCAAAIRARTPPDALAALERVKRKAKNEALEAAAKSIPAGFAAAYLADRIRNLKEPEE